MRLRRVATRDQYEQIIRLRIALRADLCDGFWKGFFQSLEIVNDLRPGFRRCERLQVIALFARKLADLRRANANHRKSGIDLESRKLICAERVTDISQGGQTQI